MGDISICGEKRFKGYSGGTDTKGFSYESWLPLVKYSQWKEKQVAAGKINKQKRRVSNKEKKAPKRLSPETGKTFTRGELYQGKRFIHYTYSTSKDGYMGEEWTDEYGWHRINISNTKSSRKRAAEEKGKIFTLTSEYMLSIYPEDNLCPILKVPLVWGGNKDDSPSMDCIIPELGYVEGNVAWICTRANVMKLTRSPYNLRKIADWIDSELAKLSKIK